MAKVSTDRTTAVRLKSSRPKISPAKTIRFLVHCSGRSEWKRRRAVDRLPAPPSGEAPGTGCSGELGRAMERGRPADQAPKLLTASVSVSYVSNTVSSFVIASRSWIRLVRFSSLSTPSCFLTVV